MTTTRKATTAKAATPAPAARTRIDHSTHDHAKSGAEGKKARAACRRALELAAKAETNTTAKPAPAKASA